MGVCDTANFGIDSIANKCQACISTTDIYIFFYLKSSLWEQYFHLCSEITPDCAPSSLCYDRRLHQWSAATYVSLTAAIGAAESRDGTTTEQNGRGGAKGAMQDVKGA